LIAPEVLTANRRLHRPLSFTRLLTLPLLAEMKDKTFRLGNVHDDTYDAIFRSPRLRSFIASSVNESLPGCSDCAYQAYCGAGPVFHHATQGDLIGHRPTSEFCRKNMAIITDLLRLIDSVDEQVLRTFWAWIYDQSTSEAPCPAR